MTFLDLMQQRRSIYAIGNNLRHSQQEIEQIVRTAVRHTPSAFHSQATRTVLLFGASHDQFWGFVREALRKIVPADAFAATAQRIDGFAAGAGTVLFYEDQDIVRGLQEKMPAYAENFPIWSDQASAIAQFAIWMAFSEAGIGASLQHYNPLADADAAQAFAIPANWKMRAQLVFGSIEAPAGEKTFIDPAILCKTFS